MASSFEIGDLVVFTPDADTVRRYGSAFPRLRIYPGLVGPVSRRSSGLVRIGDGVKGWPADQFRRLTDFDPDALETYRREAERAQYASRGECPYQVGDVIRFRPSEWCDLVYGSAFRAAAMYSGKLGTITAIDAEGYLEVDRCARFLHWSEFAPTA